MAVSINKRGRQSDEVYKKVTRNSSFFPKNEPQHGNVVLKQLKHASVPPSSGQIICYFEGKK